MTTAANNNVGYTVGRGEAGNPFYLNLPNPTQAGNALILSVSNPYAPNRTISVSDNSGDLFLLVKTVNNGTTMSSVFVAFNVAAGAQSLTVRFDAALYGCQFCLTEFDHLVGVDAASGSITSGTNTIGPGALTSTTAGDLIYQYGLDTSNTFLTSTLTGLTHGTNFTFLSADTIKGAFGISSQISFVIYDIAGASANPYDSSWTDNGNYFSANSGNFSFGSITPSTPNGLVIATVATYEGVLFSSAQTLDSVTYGGEVDADLMENADGYAHYYNPDTSPVTFRWTLGAAAASAELPQVVAFKAAGQ